MKKLIILFFAAGIIFSSCQSGDKKTDSQGDTSAAKGSTTADSAKTAKPADSTARPNLSDTTSLHGDTDSAVHPVH